MQVSYSRYKSTLSWPVSMHGVSSIDHVVMWQQISTSLAQATGKTAPSLFSTRLAIFWMCGQKPTCDWANILFDLIWATRHSVHYPCQAREQSTVLERLLLENYFTCATVGPNSQTTSPFDDDLFCVWDGALCNISHSWFSVLLWNSCCHFSLFCFLFLEICTWMHTAWKEYGHFWTTENEGIWQGATDCSRAPKNTAENKTAAENKRPVQRMKEPCREGMNPAQNDCSRE